MSDSKWRTSTGVVNHDDVQQMVLRASSALAMYDHTAGLDEPEVAETAMADLITDLMHLAETRGLRFQNVLKRARMHYRAEGRGVL
jgi:hypothetical protein